MQDSTDPTPNESGTARTSNDSTAMSDTSLAMPEPGQRIGPNRILELIAEGGMANVYKVWHEGLEIVRAIKILKPGFNEESKQRLHTEAKISAHLHHPNIVEIYGVNFWKDTVPYLEMEYIDGFSLKDVVKYQKQAHFTFAVSIGCFVCGALSYAHNQVFTLYGKPYKGVVHRDIKPANILISRAGVVKLADFGIAKPSEISLHTVGQKVMGTFSYLSPEQLNGDPLDYRCDIYSLGAVLYEIITGVKAFPQKIMSELIQKKMLNDYKPVHAFGIEVPKQLCAIIDKSMALKKEKRYATAPEMADDLLALLKKFTSKMPEHIVLEYLKNPKDTPIHLKKKRFSAPVIIAAAMILLITLSFSALVIMPNMRQAFLEIISRVSRTAGQPALKTSAESPRVEPTVDEPASEPAPRPAPAQAAASRQAGSAAGQAKAEKNKVSSAAPVDQFKAGLGAARAKRYKEAIPRLEAALEKDLGESQRAVATVNLMESYLSVGDAAGALRHANAKFINDGYFYLLCGRTYAMLGNYERAIACFGNAQTVPSVYNGATLREATYLWAKTLDQIYTLKPNSENKRACIRAWQQYSKAFCAEDATERCRDAQQRISSMIK